MRAQLNLAHGVRQFAALTPTAPAVRDGSTTVTYAGLHERSNRLASVLLDAGLKPGDRVGILLRNSIEFFDVAAALAKAGLVQVPLNPKLTTPEITYILGHAGARGLVLEDELSENAAEAVETLGLDPVLSVGGKALGRDYHQTLETGRNVDPQVEIDEHAPFTIAYTSGTTGHPKGVAISHRSRSLGGYLASLEYRMGPGRNTVSVAPMSHGGGFLYSWFAILVGGSCSILRSFDAERLLRIFSEHHTHTLFLVPTHAALLREQGEDVIHRHDVGVLDTIFFSAAPLSQPLKLWTIETFDGVQVHENYGSTETGIVTTLRPQDIVRKPKSIGQAFYTTDLRIVGEDGQEVVAGGIGELFSRSPMNMNGYHDDPHATAACSTPDGFVSAGDVVEADEEGFLYLLDRRKDVIISGGLNVYCREVEQALDEHPDVLAVAVIGTESDVWGEQVTAVVVPQPGRALAAAALQDHVRDRLATYKHPRAYEFVTELPYNAAGKVRKGELRERFAKATAEPA